MATPARTISAFGSGEFQPWSEEVDRYTLDRALAAGSGDGSVVVFPTASAPEGEEVFMNWGQMGLEHYGRMGVVARVAAVHTREDAMADETLADIEDASMFYFSGGNPAYLCRVLTNTPLWTAIRNAVDAGAAFAGCSAGACALGEQAPDTTAESLEDMLGGDWWVPGLRMLPGITLGPHWDTLDHWMPGVEKIIRDAIPRDCTLITLDEDTAIVGDGTVWRVFGKGRVGIAPSGETEKLYTAGDEFTL